MAVAAQRLPALLTAAAGAALLVALFAEWYEFAGVFPVPGGSLTGWRVFEWEDIVFAALAVYAVVIAAAGELWTRLIVRAAFAVPLLLGAVLAILRVADPPTVEQPAAVAAGAGMVELDPSGGAVIGCSALIVAAICVLVGERLGVSRHGGAG